MMKNFGKIAGYQNSIEKSVLFLYASKNRLRKKIGK
jgi:hypothetical protein